MSVRTGQKKWTDSAASYLSYAKEGQPSSADSSLKYHDRPQDGIVFEHVRGKAAAHLPGLDLARGLTKAQHADLHAGRWNGVQILKPGYAKQWVLNEDGEKVPLLDPETNKQLMLPTHTAGYDISFAASKDISEYLIAHPEDIGIVRECLLAAVDKAMTVAVEEHARLVRVPVKTPSEVGARTTKTQGSATQRLTADGLIWWTTFGAAARPTEEAGNRGYGADPHLHVHCFLSSMAWSDGRWRKIDGAELMRTADYRRDVAEVELSRLLEERGIRIAYSDVDRKGRRLQTIEGSKAENCRFFSTNSERKWKLQDEYLAKYHRKMSDQELDLAMQVTKGDKSEAAKVADRGEAEQYELWRRAMIKAGLSLDMPARGVPVAYPNLHDQIAELHRRLESSEGLNRYCEDAAIFGHDAVLPATMRAGVGLGLEPEVLRTLAQDYIDNRLIVVRDAADRSARYYTTQSIVTNEIKIGNQLDKLAAGTSPSVRREVVDAVIDRQEHAPDPGQRELIRAICSGNQLTHGVGHAGAGKGFALDIAVRALREAGPKTEIVATAVAAKRAGELARQVGADRRGSIESLHRQYVNGWRPRRNTVIILDEAALASTFDMAKLLEVVGTKAKLILIGDEKQGVAIGPAGWYGQELAKRPPVELTRVYRQADPEDQKMLDLIRRGRAPLALAKLQAQGRIHVVDKTNDLTATLRERYAVHREAGRSVEDIAVVHQGSNHELDSYNRIIQLHRARHDEIDRAESYVVDEASTGRRWTLCRGDRIVMNKGVFEGLTEPVRNGQTGTVVRVGADGAVRIRFDGTQARTATIRLKPEMDVVPVGLAYVMSTTKYQGGQAPVVLITPGSPEIASQNSGYSQTTRMVEHVEVLVDKERWDRGEGPIKALGQAWSTPEVKRMASEVLREAIIEPEYVASDLVEQFDDPLEVEVDDRASVISASRARRSRRPSPATEESQEPAADDAQRYIDEIRARMEQGYDFGIGL